MTAEEKQQIVSEVLSAIRTNSALITDLTEVMDISGGGYIEISGGRRISIGNFKSVIQTAIVDESVVPVVSRVGTLETGVSDLNRDKFNKADVVEEDGSSPDKVMSQRYSTNKFNAMGTKIGNVNVAMGTGDGNNMYLRFTNGNGSTVEIPITKASATKAGLLSAADKVSLEDLKGAKITGFRIEPLNDEAVITLTNDGIGDAFEIVIPKAGTVPTGETDPVAGVMSAEQAADLAEVVLEVFPLVARISLSNAGIYEKGQTVTPGVVLEVTRRGVGVASQVSLTTTMNVVGPHGGEPAGQITLDYSPITENTTFSISVSHRGSSVSLAQQQYRFVNYVYGDVITETPSDMAGAIVASSTLRELSTRTAYSGTLQAGRMFLFAVPGNVNLVCRHSETGAVIPDCTTGHANVPRVCDPTVYDAYSYIIVPSSDIAWNFKITNS